MKNVLTAATLFICLMASACTSEGASLEDCVHWDSTEPLQDSGPIVDGLHCFQFDAPTHGTLSLTVAAEGGTPVTVYADSNDNGIADDDTIAFSEYARGDGDAVPLAAGHYFVVLEYGESYDIAMQFTGHEVAGPATDPGDGPASAHDLGGLLGPPVGGYAGVVDEFDVYRFTAPTVGTATLDLAAEGLLISVFRDTGSVLTDEGWLADATSPAALSVPLEPGVYFVRVEPHLDSDVYTLTTSFAESSFPYPAMDPGSSPSEALDLGALGMAQTGGYVGAADGDDLFSFALQQPGTLAAELQTETNNPTVELFSDNGDGILTAEESIGSMNIGTHSWDLAAGHYYARVSSQDPAIYALTLAWSP